MKPLLLSAILIVFVLPFLHSCSKNRNYYAATDYTVGMLNTRNWHGYTYGNYKGDTIIDTKHQSWPKYFNRVIDTAFPVVRINSYVVEVSGTRLTFKTIDSVKTKLRYDSSYANSANSYLVFDWGADTMYYEHHQISEYNSAAGKYYEVHEYMRSAH